MFMAVDSNCCPICCTAGKRMQAIADIFVCPSCSAVFGEFGIVIEAANNVQLQMA